MTIRREVFLIDWQVTVSEFGEGVVRKIRAAEKDSNSGRLYADLIAQNERTGDVAVRISFGAGPENESRALLPMRCLATPYWETGEACVPERDHPEVPF